MTKVQIPSTIREATSTLAGLDDLVTAKEWHRAAIVYAFTFEGTNQHGARGKSSKHTISEFAKRGIVGLRDRNTVAIYRMRWQEAIDQGQAEEVNPGDRVELPSISWPGRGEGNNTSSGSGNGTIRSATSLMKKDPEAAAALLAAASPAVIAKAVEARPEVARAIARNEAAMESVEEYGIEHRARHQPDHEPADPGRLSRAVGNNVNKALGGGDMATEELHGAARQIMQAMVWAEEHGIEDEEAEAKAIARIKKNLRIYEQKADVTDTDREWAASQGIKL